VENWWFHQCFAGLEKGDPWREAPEDDDQDWDFNVAAAREPHTIFDRYQRECERSRTVIRASKGLEQLSARNNRASRAWSLRWILVHMIEETARHAGHMDLIRESIDGVTGDFQSED
jgi:hypothetical protein